VAATQPVADKPGIRLKTPSNTAPEGQAESDETHHRLAGGANEANPVKTKPSDKLTQSGS
jgi:hypothetical protein